MKLLTNPSGGCKSVKLPADPAHAPAWLTSG
jgi:hypothetical protein